MRKSRGLRYRLESDMVPSLIRGLPEIFHPDRGQRVRLLREPTVGSVIPDILLGIWSDGLPYCGRLNSVSRHVLAWLAARKTVSGETQLGDELLISSHAASAAVSSLKKLGAVAQEESGEVRLIPEFDFFDTVRLIAIEVKLRRWREALEQAVSYREFADEAYVVLDGYRVEPTDDLRNAFINAGIGLILQLGARLDIVLVAPRAPSPAPSADRLSAVSKVHAGYTYCFV